jgi:hypothetical protein
VPPLGVARVHPRLALGFRAFDAHVDRRPARATDDAKHRQYRIVAGRRESREVDLDLVEQTALGAARNLADAKNLRRIARPDRALAARILDVEQHRHDHLLIFSAP